MVATSSKIRALDWDDDALLLLDQRQLPSRTAWVRCTTADEVASAIRNLVVRGAPAIGVAAAYGMVLATLASTADAALKDAAERLKATRPTAINLAWAVDRVVEAIGVLPPAERSARALAEARTIEAEDAAACLRLASFGADLIPGADPVELMTHCNAGALATAGIGTALGVIREVAARGRLQRLWAPEARPVLQGARLTAWEAMEDRLPVTLLTDTAAASILRTGRVAAVFVGADRIAADGSVANKIGTYPLAVISARHAVPFYVVAPVSTFDPHTPSGHDIPIEERDGDEVRRVRGTSIAPPDVEVFNPAFDVTPPELVSAIVTDRGVAYPPYERTLETLISA